MRQALIAIMLLVICAGLAMAQDLPYLGIYEDPEASLCWGDMDQYVGKDVYVVATIPADWEGMTACEFRVANLPAPADAIVSPIWSTDLVIGDIGYDISLAWPDPQPGPYVQVGVLNFFFLVDPPADHEIYVGEGLDCECRVIVDDDFVEWDAFGDHYVINCSGGCYCLVDFSPVEESSWSSFKTLY